MSNEANASAETRVRAAWSRVTYSETGQTLAGPCYVVINAEDHPTAGSTIFMQHGRSKEVVFAAALAFTDARLEEVRQIEQEIDSCQSYVRWFEKGEQAEDRQQEAIHKRTLARLQRIRDEARRGLRQNSERSTEDV